MSELTHLDVLLNGWLLLVDAAVLAAAWRFRSRPLGVCGAGAVVALLGTTLLARALTGDLFAVLRGACWALYLHGPLDLLVAALLSHRVARVDALVVAAGGVLAAGVGVDGFLVEPRWLEVTHVEVKAKGLAQRLRIAVLTDTQSDHWGAWEAEAFRRATAERPDLVVMPGDFVQVDVDRQRYPEQVAAFRALLPLLQAPLGVYAVQGNVDWRPTWAEDLFGGTGVGAFRTTTSVGAGPIALTAVAFRDGFDRELVLPHEGTFHVAFSHGPDFALSDRVDADLLIAGHTHGGQVQLPLFGPPVTMSKVPRAWAAGGLHDIGRGRRLVVVRGVGMERGHAPRLRVNCRPELAFVDLVP